MLVVNMVNVLLPVYVLAMQVTPIEIVVSNNAQKAAVDMALVTVMVHAYAMLVSPAKHVISSIAQKIAKTKKVLHMDIVSTELVSVLKDGVMLIAKRQYVNHLQLAPVMVSVDQKRKAH
jgi:hypothetical protein|tara:strand:+ start:1297 stop:1653 length:357 start_codon:yes stop_codon:yes gene_type:complete